MQQNAVVKKHPFSLDASMRSIVLRWAAHRGNNGIATAARHRVLDALPDWAIGAPFELAELLAVVRDVALESRDDSEGACSSGLCGRTDVGPCDGVMEVAIVTSEVRGRGGCEQLSLRVKCALKKELGA
jgi:hypothetical protein